MLSPAKALVIMEDKQLEVESAGIAELIAV